jgi:hypothetical protein
MLQGPDTEAESFNCCTVIEALHAGLGEVP